jgi:hypothetical protein
MPLGRWHMHRPRPSRIVAPEDKGASPPMEFRALLTTGRAAFPYVYGVAFALWSVRLPACPPPQQGGAPLAPTLASRQGASHRLL